MGFRAESGAVDVYNIIGAPAAAGKGLMKAAMALMCSYAADKYTRNIGCLVLKNNPAVGYYKACGFSIIGDGGDHHVFKLVWSSKLPAPYDVSEK
jgi:RimJ/RimL family protein N-acetyltransferase